MRGVSYGAVVAVVVMAGCGPSELLPPEGGAESTSHDGATLRALLGTLERSDGQAGLALLLALDDCAPCQLTSGRA